jgi:glycerol-3-phosphate acyltransferase PlsY
MTAMTAIALVLSYLLGSIPTGLWLGLRLRGIDIRQHGSHNIGATNVMRVLGKKLGAFALAADALKGLLAVVLVSPLSDWPYAPLACGLAAIVGHMAPVFLRFRGGKGVATSAGVFLALCPVPLIAALVIFLLTVAVTRMVSAGSIVAAIALAVLLFLLPYDWATWPGHQLPPGLLLPIIATLLATLVVYRHRSNLQRIFRGTENRL